MKASCACNFRELETEDAAYVIDGVPFCEAACIDRQGTHGRPFQYRDPRASRDVPVGQRWAFLDHRTLADADRIGEAHKTRISGDFIVGFKVER